jgi:hypothetical protein
MITAFEIKFGLFGGGNGRSSLQGFFLGANVLNLGVGCAHLVKDSLNNLAVRAGEHLTENRAGNLDKECVAFEAAQARGLKPGGVGVDTNAGLDEFEELVPDIAGLRFTANLRSSRHCHQVHRKAKKRHISTAVQKPVETLGALKHHALEVVPAQERNFFSPRGSARPVQIRRTTLHRNKTGWILAHCHARSKRKMCEGQ